MTYDSDHPTGKDNLFRECSECGDRERLFTVDGEVLCADCIDSN